MQYLLRQAPLSKGLFQARILEWVAMPSSRASFPPRGLNPCRFMSPVLVGRFFTTSTTCEALPSQDFLFILFTQDKIDNTFSQKINRWGQGEAGISYLFCFPILNNQYHFHNSEPSA